jgi:hypothetical protein
MAQAQPTNTAYRHSKRKNLMKKAEFSEHKGEVKIKDSPNEFTTYSDIGGVTMTPEELIFHFGLRSQENPGEANGVVKVYVALAHAKRIALILAQLITQYEETFGEIDTQRAKRLAEVLKRRSEGAEKQDASDNK